MLIEIDGRRYPVPSIDDLQLRHAAQLQRELASGELSRVTDLRTINEIRTMFGQWGQLDKAEQAVHPEALFLTCFMVWASRIAAGEDMTLMEAISFPAKSLRTIREPSDKAGDSEGKARTPRRASAAGGGKRKPKRKR